MAINNMLYVVVGILYFFSLYLLRHVVDQRPVRTTFYLTELSQAHRTSILDMNPICLYAEPRDPDWVN